MAISASDVKKLRDETDAPMMECKRALEEAGGDFEKAKTILREKGKAAAAKRADRETKAGVAMLALSPCGKKLGGVVLTCETDFVARNEDFVATATELAKALAVADSTADVNSLKVGDSTVGAMVEASVAKIRENIQLAKALHEETTGTWGTYVHHNKLKAAAVEIGGEAENAAEVAHKIAVQCVAFPPEFLSKDEVPQDVVAKELETETQRAINEGKTPEIAKNIAQGRVNKEYFKSVVLLEQPFYEDLNKTVGQYVAENGGLKVKRFIYLAVGS